MKRVVITGMGVISPLGNSLPEFKKALFEGVSGAGPITKFDAGLFKTRFAAEVKGFDPLQFMQKQDARKYDLFTQYALAATQEAVTQAGIDFEQLNRNRIGVIWGSGNGGIETLQNELLEFAIGDGTPRFNPFLIPKMIVDIASGIISIRYGLRGLNFTTVSACASSTTALIDAFNYIRWGKADMIITGGSEAAITEVAVGGFNASRALSTRNKEMSTASRPFDPTRDGFVIGEGAGALVVESMEHAQQRGATILGEIVGTGMAADAWHLTGTHPEGEGAFLGMQEALQEAGIRADQLDYLNAHATSTPQGDTSELTAISRVFAGSKNLSISATKSMTGHLLGAAGAVEAIISILAIQQNKVPPTINTVNVEGDFAQQFHLPLGKATEKEIRYAMTNTFGFGGHIATALFRKWSGT
ncbi:beta-ketoacyl-ACP synthase II [Flavihumibacter sp. UBA7668]|uniref:beta-ketoacyl-ACP synthase II n=1 Tax=Flavihumibacter sp. UBA7668 TaxID=1946542 RepID=UPI0025BE6B53|nr:beta-ketoacyl-ACP synthase II [Flavihumibacter sp. UBA7668]